MGNDLFANANNSKQLVRIVGATRDEPSQEIQTLLTTSGSVGHGRNDLDVVNQRYIYSIHGDAVDIPREALQLTSPFREFARGAKSREGHLVRFDLKTQQTAVVAAGLRNPYGIAVNRDGEWFTYDADAEYDMGAPWYRPTRVVHLVSGADYGWRGVTKRWPPYDPDHAEAAPPVLDIGKGSPTAVAFGYASNFPQPYRDALYILDWAYGRVVAVHMQALGSSYRCWAKPFLKGRPLNVTDITFGPDGHMYLVTGGRKTQSAIYRVRASRGSTEIKESAQARRRMQHAQAARQRRKQLEAWHGRQGPGVLDQLWPHLDSDDPWIRHAARIAVEHQTMDDWRTRALSETRTTAGLTALMALAQGSEADHPAIVRRVLDWPLDELSHDQVRIALTVLLRCLVNQELKSHDADRLHQQLVKLFPSDDRRINQWATQLLAILKSPQLVRLSMERMSRIDDPIEQLHYLYVLRNVQDGWSEDDRSRFFHQLKLAADFQGGAGMPDFLRRIRDESIAALDDDQGQRWLRFLERQPEVTTISVQRKFVREWSMKDIDEILSAKDRPDLDRGRRLFAEAQCDRCHRIGNDGGRLGPNLTSVGSRFSRRDLLRSMLDPSAVVADPYRNVRVTTQGGQIHTGRVIPGRDYRATRLTLSLDPLDSSKQVVLSKSEIELIEDSPVSPMPTGLLNTLNKAEIRDLIEFLAVAAGSEN